MCIACICACVLSICSEISFRVKQCFFKLCLLLLPAIHLFNATLDEIHHLAVTAVLSKLQSRVAVLVLQI